MSRSGYSDECEGWDLVRWRGAVKSAIRGKCGQQALIEIAAALDALPEKTLAADSLVTEEGEFCTLGALGRARGMNMEPIDPEDLESTAHAFGISEALAAEIMYHNDEYIGDWHWIDVEICGPVRPYYPDWGSHTKKVRVPNEDAAKQRWRHMREWVAANIKALNDAETEVSASS